MKVSQKILKFYLKPERRYQLWKFFWWPSEMRVYEAPDPKIENMIFQNTR